ncbi:MAG: hypothetical protein KAS39_06900, partial [Actinomycetia bacterium]|nr:hypothetical protein [Actinomycetes bacterium]
MLENEGKISQFIEGWYVYSQKYGYKTGRFQQNRRGFGFVLTKDEDIYVAPKFVNGALPNDEVKVRIITEKKGKKEGVIEEIIERSTGEITVLVKKSGKIIELIPTDNRILYRVKAKSTKGLKNNEIVVIKITEFPGINRIIKGKVKESLGFDGDAGVDIEILIKEHSLPSEFSDEISKEAENISETVLPEKIIGREDLRDEFTVTIDGLDAKDFDDA